MSEIIRCPWGDVQDELMREYHGKQWGSLVLTHTGVMRCCLKC
jgi:3-methyladenine DNA glycosylase Tag